MSEYAELEIGLHRREVESYAVEFRFSQPNSDADIRTRQDEPCTAAIDLNKLNKLVHDPVEYGKSLTKSFFENAAIQTAFAQAKTSAQTLGSPLRMRLMIGASAPELHSVHWETLLDPHAGHTLSLDENLLFSRYLSSLDWKPVRLRAQGQLRALAAVANPENLSEYDLAPIDVDREMERIRQGLGDIPLTALPESGDKPPVTLNNLVDQLRAGTYDIFYLVCHGALIKDEAWLWLGGEDGKVGRVSGNELVTRLQELVERPRLVVLASCESAASGSGAALAALGPRLAEAGIPAVLAMQGTISVPTVSEFMPVFFRELQRDGQIDRALAVARGAVRQRTDYWMPALFMRLKSGRIWYVPGFGEGRDEFEKWQSLKGFIDEKTCTPILGPGLIETMLGSRREIAVSWAEKHGFPLSPQDKDDLPSVAQYILTSQSPAYLPMAYREALRHGIVLRYQASLPEELQGDKSWSSAQLEQALDVMSERYAQENPADPYKLLARLRLPLYITTSTLDLLSHALEQEGAQPVVRICPWNKFVPSAKAIFEEEPTPETPLVYHLFGHIGLPNSLVISEDSYFDYLIGVTQNKSLIPSSVRQALSNTSLLFLGFQLEDWEFRVFFRFLMAQEGREMLKFYSHAAAQIEPEEDRIIDIRRARRYLEEYFSSENIEIYWGSSQEFLHELYEHL